MSAPIPIKLKITNAGRLAALDALDSGLNLKLTQIAIGTGKYNSETTGANLTTLQNEIGRYPLSGGSIEPVSRTLRFSAILESGITQNAFEVGLFDEHGVLFAVASTTANDPLILVTANIAFVAAFSLVLTDVNVTNITVVDDPSSPLAIALMNQHGAHPDPHPQYPLKSVLADIIYPVGSWHGTNNASYNPATALVPLFSYETTWYLWPYVPAGVANTSAVLGQIVELVEGNGTQAATTRIWQRLPDGASAPTYTLTASSSPVDEGQQVTFTLNTTGVTQGTAVAWNITGVQSADITPNAMIGQFIVGADGSATHTITIVADEATEGTETLKFTLTYIIGKFVNVIINDSSVNEERIVTISSSTNSGINLLSTYISIHGNPTSATKAIFIIESGVEIIAPDTATAAIYADSWPTGSIREIQISSGAKVLGRGGEGGTALDVTSSISSKSGGNGGTAIQAVSGSPITINNQGLVAGGGGGGGASCNIGYVTQNAQNGLVAGGSGGAPYGKAGLLSKNTPFTSGGGSTLRMQYYLSDQRYRWHYGQGVWTRTIGENEVGNYTEYSTAPTIFDDSGLNSATPTIRMTAYEATPDFWHQGGQGGNVGENGSNGSGSGEDGTYRYYVDVGNGGLAGYIYQGPVTINNLSGGETKGRTP